MKKNRFEYFIKILTLEVDKIPQAFELGVIAERQKLVKLGKQAIAILKKEGAKK